MCAVPGSSTRALTQLRWDLLYTEQFVILSISTKYVVAYIQSMKTFGTIYDIAPYYYT